MKQTSEKPPRSKFTVAFIGITVVLMALMYFVFQYSTNDLAGKTCLQVAHQLQTQFKEKNHFYAGTIDELKAFDNQIKDPKKPEIVTNGIDPRCTSFFQLAINRADAASFEAQVLVKDSVSTINETGNISQK